MDQTNSLSKSDFLSLVASLTSQLERIDQVYPPMIADARQFDRELAKKIEGAMNADRELLQYLKSKAEAQQLPASVVVGLLAR